MIQDNSRLEIYTILIFSTCLNLLIQAVTIINFQDSIAYRKSTLYLCACIDTPAKKSGQKSLYFFSPRTHKHIRRGVIKGLGILC